MKNKKFFLASIVAISLILISFLAINQSNGLKGQVIKFGVSQGVPKLVANKLFSYYKNDELKIENIEVYSFQDC